MYDIYTSYQISDFETIQQIRLTNTKQLMGTSNQLN